MALPKTRTFNYRLKGLKKVLSFRLEVHSEAHVLFNDLLNKNKRKRNAISLSIEQVIKLAKQGIGKQAIRNTTLISNISTELQTNSSQKIFDRIFQLALEGYAQLQHEGKLPALISHRIPTQKAKPMPRPRPARQPIETEQPIEQKIISDVDKIKALIPKDLHEYVKIEYNPKAKTIIINIIQYLQHEKFMEIAKISKRYQGTYNKEKRCFIIPIEHIH